MMEHAGAVVAQAPTLVLVGSVFAASLLGSLHCAGMCGGFVCFYAGEDDARRAGPHLAYNLGRLVSYAVLGVVSGTLGAGANRLGAAAGLGRGAAVVAGFLMIVWGGVTLLRAAGVRLGAAHATAFVPLPLATGLRAVRRQPPVVRALVLGLLTTLLPCGWLYAFAATAAGTGSPWGGALVMGVFWLGTLPVMTGLGFVAQRAFGPLRRRLPVLTAAALMVLGLLTISGKFHPASSHAASTEDAHACH